MIGKFGRNYRLDISTPVGKQITIELPFTIQFNITRNTLASANQGQITIFNLGESTRNQIYKDRFSIAEYWRVSLWVGYGGRLHEVFTGNALEAYSYKQGKDWLTVLDCFDGMDGIQNGFTSKTVQAGTSNREIITQIINDMPNIVKGAIGSLGEGSSPRGKALIGQSSELLGMETGGNFFIDRETVNVLTDEEVLAGDVALLDPGQLLGTPRRREAFLDVVTLFEPQVQVGQIYEIRSLEARYNGQYAVKGFNHAATISGGVSGEARTNLSLWFGAEGLQEVAK